MAKRGDPARPDFQGGVAAPVCASGLLSFSGNNSQLGRVFRDAIPSSCPSKAYPGIFDAGTPYFFETYTYPNSTAMAQCITVNFDPNPDNNLATDCDTNAHASAYIGSYDPMNQAANYVGDVGSSITDSFSFEVPAMSDLVLVVTNTSAEEACNYQFAVMGNLDCPNPVTPPAFSKDFSPNPVAGQIVYSSKLTFTIDNMANGQNVTGLNFTDNLPAGLVVAAVPQATTTCDGGTLTADPGSSTISYSGGSASFQSTCTISVNVQTNAPGTYVNTTGDLTSAFGNSGPAAATLEVINDPEGIGLPTLSQFGILLLASLLALGACWRLISGS